ncbi:acyltransferase family protein [Ferruginibacter sp. SUN002]|uniref:acyltransferase family protein n=1 Tax=Ferruginibacter sp. SUN002 TaxID=2937789 RepID=UPI003D361538
MHNNNFNFLRLVGAILVIFSHSFYITGEDALESVNLLTHNQFEASAFGLCIFFFISGFFVTKSAIDSETVLLFLKKRFLRIFPALITLVVLSVFVMGPIITQLTVKEYFLNVETWKYLTTISGFKIQMNLPGVFTDNHFNVNSVNTSLWTISLELKLYVSLIILVTLLRNKKVLKYAMLSLLLTCYTVLAFKTTMDYVITINLVSVFCLGSFVYLAELNKKQVWISLLTISIAYVFLKLTNPSHFNPAFLLLPVLSLPVFLIGFSQKIKLRINHDISYGIYIFAFPIQQIIYQIADYNISTFPLFFFTLLITIPLAFASWIFIEKPCIQLKHKKLPLFG